MTGRRVPRWSDFRPFLRPPTSRADGVARAGSVADLRRLARRRVPRAVFDYVDGAAESEISLRRAREAFAGLTFHPRVVNDVSRVDPSATILGTRSSLPVVLAPTGLTRLMHHEGERAVARAAAAMGLPYTLSTMGTATVEEVAEAAPSGSHWFQLYMARDRRLAEALVARAAAAGFGVLVLTVDTAASGARLRDVRNGFTVPPVLNVRTLADMARHPRWWVDMVTTGPPAIAAAPAGLSWPETVDLLLDPGIGPDDVRWLRSLWAGPMVVKGIQYVEDAQRMVDLGADAVVLSSHGGRQLDRTVTPLELIGPTRRKLGDRVPVFVDSGVLSGADVVAAVALGADAVLVGRAYLYGLMAGGERGVRRTGEILHDDVVRTMRLLGVRTLGCLGAEHVELRSVRDGGEAA